MKRKIQETRNFRVVIPMKEVLQALREQGYDFPKDADGRVIAYGHEDRLTVSWSRDQK